MLNKKMFILLVFSFLIIFPNVSSFSIFGDDETEIYYKNEGESCFFPNDICKDGLECVYFQCADTSNTYCGNGLCEVLEDTLNCPDDCGKPYQVCGDGICDVGETLGAGLECLQDCCKLEGFCNNNDDCCSGKCRLFKCVEINDYYDPCKQYGDDCMIDSDCCIGYECIDFKCSYPNSDFEFEEGLYNKCSWYNPCNDGQKCLSGRCVTIENYDTRSGGINDIYTDEGKLKEIECSCFYYSPELLGSVCIFPDVLCLIKSPFKNFYQEYKILVWVFGFLLIFGLFGWIFRPYLMAVSDLTKIIGRIF